jgi:hypothetical protein
MGALRHASLAACVLSYSIFATWLLSQKSIRRSNRTPRSGGGMKTRSLPKSCPLFNYARNAILYCHGSLLRQHLFVSQCP